MPITFRPITFRIICTFKSICLGLFALMMLVIVTPSFADSADDILARFAADKFSETEAAINALPAANLITGTALLDALSDGRLLFAPDRTIYYKDKADILHNAKSGETVSEAPPVNLKKVRLNNGLRSTINAALGALTLQSPDPQRRRAAAEAVFKGRDISAMAALEAALAKETDAKVRLSMTEARAALILTAATDPLESLKAIDLIAARGDQDAVNMLTQIVNSSDGNVKNAAQTALSSINSRLLLWSNVQNVIYGLSLGSVLLLAAIGLAITFGVMGIINMAHGEMVMLGAYTTYVVQDYIRIHNPAMFDWSLAIALPLAFIFTGLVGILIEKVIIRYLYGRPLETLLATWGLSLMIQQSVRTVFGANNREVGAPSWMAGSMDFGSLTITAGRMWIIVFAIMVFIFLLLLLRFTPFGLHIRAVTQNRRMASAMGIATSKIDALAFGLGSGIAGMAGVALSQIDNVSPNLGQSYIIDSFLVVVFGGVGNLWGTLVAALTLGVANKLLEPLTGAVLAKIAMLVFIILFIQKRPRGLFALKGRSVEA